MWNIIISIRECTLDLRAALLDSEKSSHGSGAGIRVTPFELQRKSPQVTGIRVRFRAIDLGPLEPKQLDW